MANSKERIDALEAQIWDMFKSEHDALGILKQFSLRLDALEVNLEATDNTRYAESMEWEGRFQELQDRVEHHARHAKEPKSYRGARDAKELENFLFDVEQYFRAIRVDSEATKVSMATVYLVGDAKLWWRKKYAEVEDGSCILNTWEILKSKLKSDMSAVNRLFFFFFMEGLKPWAHTELNRRRVGNVNGKKPKDMTPRKKGDIQGERLDVYGHQGVLMQECHSVAYESRKLNEAERRYTTHEKELLTARWQELLVDFSFMLEYRAGSTNSVADALNRRAEPYQVALMAMNAIVRADS
ncbi:hypothetical protein RJ639_042249 [Escallonia herrerae]|uniref:Reverse transcriptase RNase H-like domain-containing protein n=1 Tax=Escallonia herrerae TaxID=1293975 RepID=A0AA88WIJ8_9ASTE|nr:hypothetical protein RJ639_042249 [Escallonia herrerae]